MVSSSDGEDFFASSPSHNTSQPSVASVASDNRHHPHHQQQGEAERTGSTSPGKKRSDLFRGDEEEEDDDDVTLSEPVQVVRKKVRIELAGGEETSFPRRRQSPGVIMLEPDAKQEGPDRNDWPRRYIGHFCLAGWSLSKGRNYAEQGAKMNIQRQRPAQSHSLPPSTNGPSGSKKPQQSAKKQTKLSFNSGGGSAGARSSPSSTKGKQKEDYVVRFGNTRGFEVGRLPTEAAIWISKLMDLDLAEFEATVVDCPPVLTVGSDILLDVKAYLKRSAFPAAIDVRRSRNTHNEPAKNFFQETAETSSEKELRQRKAALIRLFKACDLKPTQANDILQQHSEDGSFGLSAMLDHYGGRDTLGEGSESAARIDRLTSPSIDSQMNGHRDGHRDSRDGAGASIQDAIPVDSAADADAADGQGSEVNDGTEIEAAQLDQVYSKAQRHDAELPEYEPPDTFNLTLRPYQKQALGWMRNMEQPASMRQGREGQRQEASLHPLWQEYRFLVEDDGAQAVESGEPGTFYFNPYIGEMSLDFQPASHGTRGGILADEMGLGKTIMVASLLHTNRAPRDGDEDEEDVQDEDRARQVEKKGPRQTSLASAFAQSNRQARKAPSAGQVTLVVAPMSLVGQWRNELERASKAGSLAVMLYYAEGKADLMGRLEGGSVDVVITSYGTLVSEYKRFADLGGAAASASKVTKVAPLYAVDWLRVILDEAHNIRNRTTRNARACHDLMARRRWCLTGSPIVNRLTDLYSLLNFLRVEPWGDFSFFNSFIGKPFANKNPKALEIVQVVLESILLRREKKMRDKDGKPIVSLPSKSILIKHLEFSEIERKIYDLCFDRAWIQYQRMRDDGSMTKNLSVIFSVLMKLRQAVCHPLLVLQAMQASHIRAQEKGDGSGVGALDEEAEREVKALVARYQAGQADGASAEDDETGSANLARLEESILIDGADLQGEDQEECPICHDPQAEAASVPCGHKACKACLVEELQRCEDLGQTPRCIVCGDGPFSIEDIHDVATAGADQVTTTAAAVVDTESSTNSDSTMITKPTAKVSWKSFAKDDFRSSTKLDALLSDLTELRMEEPDFKGVVFSQFTSFLDLVEVVLKRNRHPFVRLDGTVSQKDREMVLRTFSEASSHMLILVSLRAGGVGLNLTSAHHCWLLDCWWNASTEDQAVDRVHRIGQMRDVIVHRYLIADSVEDRILAIQKRKMALVKEALGGGGGTSGGEQTSETVENLRILFGDK